MIALPPLSAAVKLTVADLLPRTAMIEVGAVGSVFGVTAVEALDSAELPAALVACTVNV